MMKIVSIVAFIVVVVFTSQLTAYSSSIKSSRNKEIRHSKIRKSDPVYRLRWKEQTKTTTSGSETHTNKIIVNDSVCYNYRKGSIEYRGCRKQARKHFRKKCKFFKEKYRSTQSPYDEEYKIKRDMFCLAGSNFQP